MKYCTNCILPSTYPGIYFNETGLCNYCISHQSKKYKGQTELEKIYNPIKKQGLKYDCIAGISGGRDSAYMLYYLVKVCKLNVLAVHGETGLNSEIATANVQQMVSKLNTELETGPLDFLNKCLKHNLLSWLRKPSPATLSFLCSGCASVGTERLLQLAKSKNIPLIFLGNGSPTENTCFRYGFFAINPFGRIFFRSKLEETTGLDSLSSSRRPGKKVLKLSFGFSMLFGILYEILRNPFFFIKKANFLTALKDFLFFFRGNQIQKQQYPNQKVIGFFDYIEWNENTILTTIKKELNWKAPAQNKSTWRFDCQLGAIKDCLLKKTAGFSAEEDCLSVMIREKMISREDALKRIASREKTPPIEIEKVFNYLKLDPSLLKNFIK
jgi:hypothetical protein